MTPIRPRPDGSYPLLTGGQAFFFFKISDCSIDAARSLKRASQCRSLGLYGIMLTLNGRERRNLASLILLLIRLDDYLKDPGWAQQRWVPRLAEQQELIQNLLIGISEPRIY